MSNTEGVSAQPDLKPVLTLAGHNDRITDIAFLPGDQQLVTGSADKTIRIWDLVSGTQAGTHMEYQQGITGLAVTNDGKKIVSSVGDSRKIIVWDVETQKVSQEWKTRTKPSRVAISADDRLVAYYDSPGLAVRELNSGQIKHKIDTTGTYLFSPHGDKLACVQWDSVLRILDVETGQFTDTIELGHKGSSYNFLWSHDAGRLYAARQRSSKSSTPTIWCWSSATGKQIGEPWTGHTDWICSLSISPDGAKLASASYDKTVRFWDVTSGRPVGYPLQHEDRVSRVSFSLSGEYVASATEDFKVSLWLVPRGNSDQTEIQLLAATRAAMPIAAIDRHIVTSTSNNPSSLQLLGNLGNKDHSDSESFPKRYSTSVGIQTDCSLQRPATSPQHLSSLPSALDHMALPRLASAPPQASSGQKSQSDHSLPEPPDLSPYIVKLDEQIHRGNFSDVFRCLYRYPSDTREVAVKVFRFAFSLERGARYAKMLRREMEIWKRLNHVNIVPFLGTASGFGTQGSTSFVSLWIPNGNLHQFLANHDDELNIQHRLKLLSDVANGLHYLHNFLPNARIVHGDLDD